MAAHTSNQHIDYARRGPDKALSDAGSIPAASTYCSAAFGRFTFRRSLAWTDYAALRPSGVDSRRLHLSSC